jgi:uncharacterized membrane protein YdjX (TVP38/TMEM64 family)
MEYSRPMRLLCRLLPLVLLLLAAVAVWRSGLPDVLSWGRLARNQAWLAGWADRHPIAAPVLYAAAYAAVTALSVPEAAVLTVAGGLLLGTILGAAMAVIGATLGAAILFLVARSAFGGAIARRAGPRLARMREELHHHGFSYLLAIRLVPVFPFWLINLAAAFGGMRLIPFTAATLLGIIPGTVVYAWIGADLGSVLAAGRRPELGLIFSPPILLPLLALAMLALAPVAWRHWKRANV